METKISMLLKEYGLDENEIRVYLVLVGSKETSAYKIAKEAKIHKSTCYDVLERLINKGFANKIMGEGKQAYSSLEIEKSLVKIKEKETILLSLIPEFEKIKEKGISKVSVLESKEGQKQFNFSLFNRIKKGELKELYMISGGPSGFVNFQEKEEDSSSQMFLERLLGEIKKSKFYRGKDYKGIWNEKFRGNKLLTFFSGFGEDRFLKKIPTKATTVIFGEYVVFLFTINNTPQVIEIQNKMIAEEMKSYFLYLWGIARK